MAVILTSILIISSECLASTELTVPNSSYTLFDNLITEPDDSLQKEENSDGLKVLVSLGGSYGLPFGNRAYTQERNSILYRSDTIVSGGSSALFSRFGQGFNFDFGVAFVGPRGLGIEIGGSFFSGNAIKSTKASGFSPSISNFSELQSATMASFIPAVVYHGKGRFISPYAKMGMLISTSLYHTTSSGTLSGGSNFIMKTVYAEGLSFGTFASLGLKVPVVQDKMYFSAGIDARNINYSPDRSQVIYYTVDGVNQLPTLSEGNRLTLYYRGSSVNSISSSGLSASENDPTTPGNLPKYKVPFHSIAFNFKVIFNI